MSRRTTWQDGVQKAFDTQELWLEPLKQLNLAFASGAGVTNIFKADQLHPMSTDVFRHGETESKYVVPLDLYKHEVVKSRIVCKSLQGQSSLGCQAHLLTSGRRCGGVTLEQFHVQVLPTR